MQRAEHWIIPLEVGFANDDRPREDGRASDSRCFAQPDHRGQAPPGKIAGKSALRWNTNATTPCPAGYSDNCQNGNDPATVFRLALAAKAQTLEVPVQP